jgi:hypothetical protein
MDYACKSTFYFEGSDMLINYKSYSWRFYQSICVYMSRESEVKHLE